MFRIDIEDSSGNKLGSGPITSASGWTSTARMDAAGTFSFSMPASDSKADLVQETRVARCFVLLNGAWTEVGAGIIDKIEIDPQPDGTAIINASGNDLTRELTFRSVGQLELANGGAAVSHAYAVSSIAALIPSGWTITADPSPAQNALYARFAGESVLSALLSVAEKSYSHFYTVGRTLTFSSSFASSGVRAVQAQGALASGLAAIDRVKRIRDTYDLITRIIPYGAGNADVRLTLKATQRTAATGYTLDKNANYIKADSAESTYGRRERAIEFKDITPVSSSTADIQAAANMLYDQAYRYLQLYSQRGEFYEVRLLECPQILRPLQSIRVVYRDVLNRLSIDTDLYILEATVEVTTEGVRTTDLVVSTLDRWPSDDVRTLVGEITKAKVYQAHPQLNANSYVISYSKNVDETEVASFRFRFDSEVFQLTRATFDFQLLEFESTVKTVALEQSTGGTITTSFSGNSGGSGAANTGGPSNNNTGAAAGSTGEPSNNNSGAATGSTGEPSNNNSGDSGTLTTGTPQNYDVDIYGQHGHQLYFSRESFNSSWYTVYYDEFAKRLKVIDPGGGSDFVSSLAVMTASGNHNHGLNNHTHTLNSHTHTLNSHTHDLNSHTHSLNNHTHNLNSHTHSIDHTHDISHSHSFTPSVTTVYGIFRDNSANVFALADLEYSLDGSTWYAFQVGINGYTSLGDGWHRVDLTALLQDSTTLRPLSNNNRLQIRRKSTGATGKRATIDAQLNIRTIIQAVALS